MSNDLRIEIVASLDSKASQIELQNKINELAKNIKLNINIETEDLKKAQSQIKKMQEVVHNIVDKSDKIDLLPDVKNNVNSQIASYKSLQDRVNEIKKTATELSKVSVQTGKDIDNINKATISYTDKMGRQVSETYRLVQKNMENISGRNGELIPKAVNSEWVKESQKVNDNIEKRNKLLDDEAKKRQQLADQMAKGRETSAVKRKNEDLQLAENQAKAINKNIEERKKLEQDYDQWWQKALKERQSNQEKIIKKETEQRRKEEKSYDDWWNKALKERGIKEEQQIDQIAQKRANANRKALDEKLDLERKQAHYINKVLDDQYKENQAEKQKTKELEQQLKLYKEQQRINVDNLKRRFGDKADNEALDGFLRRVNNLKTTAPDVNKSMKQLNMQFKDISSNVRTSASHVLGFGDALSTALQKFPIWLVAGSITFLPIRAFQSAIEQIITIDDQMTELKRVMDAPPQAFNRMLEESIELGDKLSSSVNDILTAVSGFGRQGFSEKEVMYLAEASTVLKNISDLNADESMDSLTSVMIQFNKEATEAIQIADKFNEIDNNFSVTTKILAEGAAKAGAVASTYSVSLDNLLGYITAISAATRESGSVVGNSLKSIFSRLNLSQSQRALESVGVETRKANGELKSATEILSGLSERWSGLTQETKQNLATTVAGRYQLSRFLALMNNFQMSVDASSASISSQGSSLREHSEYTKSLTARIERLKNAWTELTLEMGDAVLTDSIILTVESLRSFTDVASKVTDIVGVLPFVFGGVSAALILFSKRFRTAVVDMKILEATSKGLIVSLSSLKVAMRGLLATTGVGLVFAGIGFAIEKLINRVSSLKQQQKELKQQQEEINKSYSVNSKEINQLARDYEMLNKQVNSGDLSKSSLEYLDVQNKLGELLPILVSHEDERGNKILRNVEAVKQELEYAQKLKENYEETEIKNFENDLTDRADQIKDLQKEIARLQKAQTTGYANYEGSGVNLQAQRDQIANERELQQLLLDTNEYVKNKSDLFLSNSGATQNLNEASQKLIASYIDENNNIKEAIENGESYEDVVSNLVHDTTDFGEALSKFNSVIDSGTDDWKEATGELEKYGFNVYEIDEYVQDYTTNIESNTDALNENAEATEELADISQVLFGITKDEIELLEYHARIYEILSQQQNLNAQQTEALAQAKEFLANKYPHLIQNEQLLIKEIYNEIGADKALLEATAGLASGMLTNQQAMTATALIESKNRIKILKAEIAVMEEMMRKVNLTLYGEEGGIHGATTGTANALQSRINELSNLNVKLDKSYQQLATDFNYQTSSPSSTKSGSSSSANEPSQKDKTDALIRQFNLQQELLSLDSEKIRKQIEIAKTQGDINTQLKLTQDLTNNEQKRISELKKVKDLLHEQANAIRSTNKQYDTSKWFDPITNEETIEYVEQHRKASKEQQEQIDKVFTSLQKLKNAYGDTSSEIVNLRDEILKLNTSLKEQSERLADDIISNYQEGYRQQQRIRQDALDTELRELETAHQKKMSMLDEELSSYERLINAKIKEIDLVQNEEDFDKQLTEALAEKQELQNQINTVGLVDTIEAQAKRRQLEKDLDKQIEKIEELKLQRTRELRKQELNDDLEQKRQLIDNEKDAATESYEAQKDRIDKEKQYWDRHYENLINDERKFASMREEIMSGHFDTILEDFGKFESEVEKHMALLGESITLNFIDKLREASDLMNTLAENNLGNSNAGTWTEGSPNSNISSVVNQMKSNSQKWMDANPEQRRALEEENQQLGKSIGATYDPSTGTWWKDNKRLFHKGGIVGGKTSRLGELLDKLFNSKNGEIVTKSLVGELQIPPQNFATGIQRMQNSILSSSKQATQPPTISIGSLMSGVKIDKSVDADRLMDQVMDKFVERLKPYGFIK